MKLTGLIGSLTIAFLVSGCATNQHAYSSDGKCITCWNNPLTGKPINHDGTANQIEAPGTTQGTPEITSKNTVIEKNRIKPSEHQVKFSVPVNVDIAYLKIKKEFQYYSEQEIRQEWGSLAQDKMQTFDFAYDATPSVYYRMRAARKHDGIQTVIDSKIEKQAEKESSITITYWLKDPSINASQFGESLQRRTIQALNN